MFEQVPDIAECYRSQVSLDVINQYGGWEVRLSPNVCKYVFAPLDKNILTHNNEHRSSSRHCD